MRAASKAALTVVLMAARMDDLMVVQMVCTKVDWTAAKTAELKAG